MSVVVVGSVALDSVQTPTGKVDDAIGGSATYFSIAGSRFSNIDLVGIVGRDFPKAGLELFKAKNINIDGLEIVDGKTFRWGGRYKLNMNERDTLFTELNVFENFQPKLPDSYKNNSILFLGNIHPELQLDVLKQMNNESLIILDTMNLWIEISREKLLEVINKSDVVIINEDEVRQLMGNSSVYKSAKEMLKMKPKILIIKKGKNGALIYFKNKMFVVPAYPVEKVVDPTGAGDSFAGGFVGYLDSLNKKNHTFRDYKMAMIYGTVMASFLVESFSINKLNAVTDDEIETRVKEMIDMITI
ncbi:MAG: PfkB family carbohydrate kinase [Candidatus Marinimicrobia bacterium]|nr:PfkB family carbohydrate kinase [Candidatus Neomarinimicrobiota bacterium]